ncbi:hypothetical protein [Burkholderia pseudomallei]|uniref:hypothetical protein n=1 Tax=Burkholderia pseudomallei TaxID=28450 RepID=UPI0012F4B1E6|nr:hypothetical protein [Burkholderia pseudomallei]
MTTFTPGVWGRLFGGGSRWELVLGSPRSEIVEVSGRRRQVVTASLEKARIEAGWLWATLTFDHEGEHIRLAGLTRRRAAEVIQSSIPV